MLTTKQALLRSILDNPEADDPRLQYADCVRDEGDDVRADFICLAISPPDLPPIPRKPSKPIQPMYGYRDPCYLRHYTESGKKLP